MTNHSSAVIKLSENYLISEINTFLIRRNNQTHDLLTGILLS